MWTSENRTRYSGAGLRYPSDLTDEEWAETDSPGAAGWPSAPGGCPGCPGRDSVCPGKRLPVAAFTQGSAATQYLPRLPSALGVGWHAGAHPLSAVAERGSMRVGKPARAPRWWTAKVFGQPQKGPAPIQLAMMQARKSRGSNTRSSSIHSVSC